ncbi:hypothetical protein MKW92_043377 [Papaver armeniacum]|nr:hypothetical protein MKW92_043377 [Papaver armeniacum]
MSATELGDDRDHRSHEEMMLCSLGKIESLLTVLVGSQAKLAESQSELVESHKNTQLQLLEILRSTAADKVAENPSLDNHQQQEDDHQEVKYFVRRDLKVIVDAVRKNDWENVFEALKKNPRVVKQPIAIDSSTLLHLVIYQKRGKKFVEEIVKLMESKELEYKIRDTGFTALHTAARYGDTEAVKMMVNKHPRLTLIRDKKGMIPLEVALDHVTKGQQEIADYLYNQSKDIEPTPFEGVVGARILCSAIEANFYDMALSIVQLFPEMVMLKSQEHDMCGLELLVRRPFAFRSGVKLTGWQKFIYSLIQVDMEKPCQCSECIERDEENVLESSECTKAEKSTSSVKGMLMRCLTRVPGTKQLSHLKLMHKQATALLKQMLLELDKTNNKRQLLSFFNSNPDIIKVAIKHGVTEFVRESLKTFDYLTECRLPVQNMIEMAIEERNETIVTIICEHADKYGDKIDMLSTTDKNNNTILHYAAKLAPFVQLNSVSGVAFQMQRELQWFKGVAGMISENDKLKRNKEGHTANSIFMEEHSDLMKKGEDWMKDTSGSCMIVTALVATVAFAAAFTVPGGNISDTDNTENGFPVFLGQSSFTVFAVADAFALFSSITSVLMFLSVYTSRYAEIDFLKSLPQKLIIGLATLIISMAAILVAFCASLIIVVGKSFRGAWIPIVMFGGISLLLFVCLQLPLFLKMVHATYCGSLFGKHRYTDYTAVKNYNTKKTE